jgi:light-harvesting complex 1 beta chain
MPTVTALPMATDAVPAPERNLGIFVLCFAFVLAIALLAQLVFVEWRPWFPGAEGEKSLFKGVKAAVYTFMSYLS